MEHIKTVWSENPRIEIFNSDCMEGLKEFKDDQFDLAIVDPPYRDENQPTKDMRKKGGKMQNFGKSPKDIFFNQIKRTSKDWIIWGGNNFIEYLNNTNCFIFWDKYQSLENFSDGELALTSFNKVAKCFRYPIHKHNQINKIHPTQKPVKLYKWLLKNYAKEGNTILDTHLGSGSIAIACYDMGFSLTGFEIDKDYYDAAHKRFKQHIAQLKLF